VQQWLPGREPGTADWPAVADELRRLHELTTEWPLRPNFLGTAELLTDDRSGDVDLTAMPADAVVSCRAAWRALPATRSVIHGIGFLDWDEARVDSPDLDMADLPIPALPPERQGVAKRAVDAWEAANGWLVEPEYARTRLTAL
jgi:hypothetical protein